MNFQIIESKLTEKMENNLLQAVKEFKDTQTTVNRLAIEGISKLLPTNMISSNKSARKVVEILTKRCCALFKVHGPKMPGMLRALKELDLIPNDVISSIKEIHKIGNTDSHEVGLETQIICNNYYKVNKLLEHVLMWYVNNVYQLANYFKKQSHQFENSRNFFTNNSHVYDTNEDYSLRHQNNFFIFIADRRNPEINMMRRIIL